MDGETNKVPLRLLLVEDSEPEALLLVREVGKGGFQPQFRRVDTGADLSAALQSGEWDVVVSDYEMPCFSAPEALAICQRWKPDIPFIVVTGKVGEDAAVSTIKAGAYDYLMKDRLARLPDAIRSALEHRAMERDREDAILALRENEEKYRLLVANSPDLIAVQDVRGEIVFISQQAESVLGYPASHFLHKGFPSEYICPADLARVKAAFAQAMAGEQIVDFEYRFLGPAGQVYWLSHTAYPTFTNGKMTGVQSTIRNITQSKAMAEERDVMMQLLAMLNAGTDFRGVMKDVLRFLQDWSGCDAVGIRLKDGPDYPYFETRGFSADFLKLENTLCVRDGGGCVEYDAQGEPILECMCGNILCGRTDSSRPFFTPHGSFWSNGTTELLASTTDEGRGTHTRNRCNSMGYESVALVPLRNATTTFGLLQFNGKKKGCFTVGSLSLMERMADNIAMALAQRMAEGDLRKSEEKYRVLVENLNDVIFTITAQGIVTYVNPVVERLAGYTPAEIIGQPFPRFIYPEDLLAVETSFRRVLQGQQETIEYRIICKSGGTRWVVSSSMPSKENEAIAGILGRLTDITDRKLAAVQKEMLVQADKMVSLGTLVSGVAHEINNPNNFVMLNVPILREAWEGVMPILEKYYKEHGDFSVSGMNYSELRGEIPALFSGIQDGSRRIKQIVADLKRFARLEPPDFSQEVRVNEVVKSATSLMSNLIRKSTRKLIEEYGDDLPPVRGSFQKIEQVVINLISNACEALRDPQQRILLRTALAESGDMVIIQVADQGCGIPENIRSRLTDPFFTTKRDSGGTGLGLSVSAGIIKDHNGTLCFQSEEGMGTTVTVSLPILAEAQN